MITQDGYWWKPFLWNEQYGYVESTGEQWTTDKGVRYGAFRATYMGQHVNLKMEDVLIEHYIGGVAV